MKSQSRKTHLSEGRRECTKLGGWEEKWGSFPTEQTTFQEKRGSVAYWANLKAGPAGGTLAGRGRGHTERK